MRRILLLAVAMLFSVTSFAQTKFNVDTYHSFLNFSVGHLGISFVDGRMDKYEGDLEMKDEDITTAKFNFTIDASSVNTGVQMRDDHLRSADFFEVETYKEIKFVSTSIKKEGSNYKLHGN
ncbi:MAG TPA: YceI family protein, partial [Flavobacterium sp.]|nr:YceI family protein [Flavobacterium sp.]